MKQEFNSNFARKVMQDKNNPAAKYLKFCIEQDSNIATPSSDFECIKLQKELMTTFGYNPNNPEQYAKVKYLLSNIEKIIGYYFYRFKIHEELIAHFYIMRLYHKITDKETFDTIVKAICMFFVEKHTRDFILGKLKPYIEEMAPEDFVWIPADKQHDYSTAILTEKLKGKQNEM